MREREQDNGRTDERVKERKRKRLREDFDVMDVWPTWNDS